MSDLNAAQQQAIQSSASAVMVQAGPGTGKTHTLTAKIIDLVNSGVEPQQILALTFTKKAAQEMQERVQAQLVDKQMPWIGTFHAFALHFLYISVDELLSEAWQEQILLKLQKQHPPAQVNLKNLHLALSLFQSQAIELAQFPVSVQKILQLYQKKLKKIKKYDYAGLLTALLQISQKQDFSWTYKYVLVDEYQDLNPVQQKLILAWQAVAEQVFLIGDPFQAIYGFRGAGGQVTENFQQNLQDIEVFSLEKNYRSGQKILDTAHVLIPESQQLQATQSFSSHVNLVKTLNQYSEAEWIVQDIEQKLGGTNLLQSSDFHQVEEKTRLKDFAIIYRSHYLSQTTTERLLQSGLPIQKIGQDSIFAQPLIQLIIDILQLNKEQNSQDLWRQVLSNSWLKIDFKTWEELTKLDASLEQAIRKIIGQKIISHQQEHQLQLIVNLLQKAEQNKSLMPFIEAVIIVLQNSAKFKQTDLELLQQFQANIYSFTQEKDSVANFLHYVTQLEKSDFYDQQVDKINLLSMHAAKGLEFDYVYLIGFEQGLVPFKKAKKTWTDELQKKAQAEEEKRLFYVTLTRAKKSIFLLQTKYRYKNKSSKSVFYKDIKNYLHVIVDSKLKMWQKKLETKKMAERQGSLF